MIQTGVTSTGSRRSARRKRLLRFEVSGMRVVESLSDHHLEAALQLRIARVLQRGQGFLALQVHLALQRRAPAFGAGFAVQRPAAEQVLLQREPAVARRAIGSRRGLHVEVHATWYGEGMDIVSEAGIGDG